MRDVEGGAAFVTPEVEAVGRRRMIAHGPPRSFTASRRIRACLGRVATELEPAVDA